MILVMSWISKLAVEFVETLGDVPVESLI